MKSITRQIIDLQNKSSEEMRDIYKSLFDEPLPHNASHLNLRTKIAYRMQELALGGLSDNVKDKLNKLAQGISTNIRKHSDLMVGTKIQRQWNGNIYEVEVLRDGFEYQGQKFKSLTAVAKKITGSHWNGPKFFKLRNNI